MTSLLFNLLELFTPLIHTQSDTLYIKLTSFKDFEKW